ncbi:MAG: hypothetical protein HKP27_04910, partial [Myxococcales bacterium]|nr:hypothetical protein [Myxococcales bacterium]
VKAPQHGVFHHQVLLRCLGAFEGFVRHSLRQPEFESVADFAMLSRSFPNSLLSSLERLEAQLEALTDGNRESRPRQIAGMIRSGLEYHGLVEGEPAMDSLDEIISGLGLLSEAVTERFFTGDAVIQSGMTHVGGRL